MPRNDIGDLRRSAAAAAFGPGAIIDFRAGDAAISAVAAGLEEWDANFPPAGELHPQAIREERLQQKLHVRAFRLPPVRDPSNPHDAERALAAVRFPQWLQCPQCDRIGDEQQWSSDPGKPQRWCPSCTATAPGRRPVTVIPVRFVMSCEAGHLDEFPWHAWVQHAEGCANRRFLQLRSEEAGLAGLFLSCPTCHSRRSMDGIMARETWTRFPNCRGKRPWLAAPDEPCAHKMRAAQRGASNLYFPVTESALSIPPWSDRLQEAIGNQWEPICDALPEDRSAFIRILASGALRQVLQELQMTPEALATEIARRLSAHSEIQVDDLRVEEHRQFTGGAPVTGLDGEFEIRPQTVPEALRPWFSRLVKAVRLREVRALTGFTRIIPPGDTGSENIAALSVSQNLGWLPAVEVRGEGIYLEFDSDRLAAWEALAGVQARALVVHRRWLSEWEARYGRGAEPARRISPRFLLIHTFAHALMRQLTLDCGYASTALRERLYVSEGAGSMAGVLVYTATTDDDGTLGGLQRQGEPVRIARTVTAALRAQEWCSSDPLCIEDMMNGEDALSLAACHACALAPETSCEEFNRFLDRGMLTGTPTHPDLGFFRNLIAGGLP